MHIITLSVHIYIIVSPLGEVKERECTVTTGPLKTIITVNLYEDIMWE